MNITLSHIDKRFGDKVVLSNLSLTFFDGKTTLLMGESGKGKTTLFQLLLGFETPDKGEITGLPKEISAAFQNDALCPQLSTLDNIRLALPSAKKEDILLALEAVGLGEDAHTKASALSGGMGRRVSVVRAMLSDAPLVLLDEPFRGLDEETKERTAALIVKEKRGRTLIVITHDRADKELLEAESVIFLG